jgi:raffinose/stachyose/melibiose transport system permease protein
MTLMSPPSTSLPPAAVPPPPSGRARSTSERFRMWREESGAGFLFTMPVLALLVLLLVYPMLQSLFWSFTDFDGYSLDYDFIGLANYANVFQQSTLLDGLVFTLLFTVATTVIITALAIPLALVLNQKFIGRDFTRSIFFFPAVPSIALFGLVWGFILNPLGSGALNGVLDALFGIGPLPWLSDETLARVSVIIVAVWSGMGWHAILYLAYLQSIPTDFYEAAGLDGATRLQQFRYLTLPMLAPAVTVSTLLLVTGGFKVYELPLTLTNGGPGTATYTITQAIITGGVGQGRYGQASALSVVFMLAVALVVLLQLYLSRRVERNLA